MSSKKKKIDVYMQYICTGSATRESTWLTWCQLRLWRISSIKGANEDRSDGRNSLILGSSSYQSQPKFLKKLWSGWHLHRQAPFHLWIYWSVRAVQPLQKYAHKEWLQNIYERFKCLWRVNWSNEELTCIRYHPNWKSGRNFLNR